MLAALNRCISKFADCCCLFYQLLKKWKGFQWNEECERAFQDLKEYLTRAPMLAAPKPGEDLFMYLSVSDHAVSAVLLWDRGSRSPCTTLVKLCISNNEAKYEALLVGLRTILDIGACDVEIYLDSWLVVSQVQGSFKAKVCRMKQYLQVVKQVMSKFRMTNVA